MEGKTVVVVGAGATFSDGSNKPKKYRPPLDSGFFKICRDLRYSELRPITAYLENHYSIDPTDPIFDSLERIMAIIYADITNPTLSTGSLKAFRSLIQLFNRRIAETTNELNPTTQCNLYRLITRLIKSGVSPSHITIVTFNQDLQIEKVLDKIQQTKSYDKHGIIFRFPGCYRITNGTEKLSAAPAHLPTFPKSTETSGIAILKLHGSLNWFSTHTSSRVPKNSILSTKKDFFITPRRNIPIKMEFQREKKSVHTFPMIIPPINNKASVIHKDLHPIWKIAEQRMRDADNILVFGYSCPQSDFESANLFRRAANAGTDPERFSVINPDCIAFNRFVEVTSLAHLSFFSDADSFVKRI